MGGRHRLLLRALLTRLAGQGVALFGVLLWAVSPYFILMSVNGLETGVALFFTVALPLAYCAWIHGGRTRDAKRALAFGGLAGLAILARLDLALLLAAIAIDWLIRERARGWRTGATVARRSPARSPSGCPGDSPVTATGHWLPASGLPAARSRSIGMVQPATHLDARHAGARAVRFPNVPAAYHLDVATKLGVVFLFENPLLAPLRANVTVGPWADIDGFFPYRLLVANPFLATVLAVVAVVALAVAWRQTRPAAAAAGIASGAAIRRVLAIYLVLFAIGYTWYSPTHWYFNRYLTAPILLTTVVMLAEAARWIAGRWRTAPFRDRRDRARDRGVPAGPVAIFRSPALVGCAAGRLPRRLERPGPRIAAGQRVGAFQAGIYGYFSGRDIVNLDGKVNQDAAAAMRDGHLDDYIRAQKLRYVIEVESVFHVLHRHHDPPSGLSFRPVAAIGGPRLYEFVDTTGHVLQ